MRTSSPLLQWRVAVLSLGRSLDTVELRFTVEAGIKGSQMLKFELRKGSVFLNPSSGFGFMRCAERIYFSWMPTVEHEKSGSDVYTDTMLGYANSIHTVDGGTRIDAVKASLTRTLNNLGKKLKNFKTRLGNQEVTKVVDQSVQEYLTEYLELHPDVLNSILSKSLNALKAALEAKRARELVRSKSVLKSSSLPGKLADCSATNPKEAGTFQNNISRYSVKLTKSR